MRRIRQLLSASLLALAVSCGGGAAKGPAAGPEAAADDSFRAEPPPPGPTPELIAPIPEKRVLENGLTVLAYRKSGLPLVYTEIVLESGSSGDPEQLPGLAGFTGDMLKQGTTTKSAEQIADAVETLGSSLSLDVDEDTTSMSFTALSDNYGPVFDVAADVLKNPAFAKEEIERVRKRRLGALAELRDDPHQSAWKVFKRTLYGEHPYAHTVLGEQGAIEKVGPKELRSFYDSHYGPANAAVIVVGDISVEQAVAEVQLRLGDWKGKPAATPAPKPPSERVSSIVLVNKREAPQSQLKIGHIGVERDHPDYYALVLCNAILGGMFNSRINMNLREDKGYTYGARSSFEFWRGAGPFVVSAAVRTDVTAPAIKEVLKEIDLIRQSDVTPKELESAKSRYSLSLPGYFQSVGSIGSMFANIFLFDLPLDYYQQLPKKIEAVTIADVRRVAEQHLHPAELSIVVVGDKNKVIGGLGDLERGAIELRDADGRAVD